MPYLVNRTEFETAINRGPMSFRSKRLDAVVASIKGYIDNPSGDALNVIERAWSTWREQDPKEFHNRGGLLLQPHIQQEIAEQGGRFWGSGAIRLVDPAAHPEYVPQIWSHHEVQYSTNCYAYACNDPWGHTPNTRPQPGQQAGQPASAMRGSRVRAAVQQDDLQRRQRLIPMARLRNEGVPTQVVNQPGHYLIALVVAPNVDYHWVRQDRSGYWSHKPGWDPATDKDANGMRIHDPRTAAFRVLVDGLPRTYRFETFYYCPRGGVRTGTLGTHAWVPVPGSSSMY